MPKETITERRFRLVGEIISQGRAAEANIETLALLLAATTDKNLVSLHKALMEKLTKT